jgi:hypothetical protein
MIADWNNSPASGLAPEIAMFGQASELIGQDKDWYIKSSG